MPSRSCHVCGSVFIDEEDFRTHCIEYHEYCVQCDEIFGNKAGFLTHVRSAHKFTSSVNQPNSLPTTSTGQNRANGQVPAPEPEIPHPRQCSICKVYFADAQSFEYHQQLGHTLGSYVAQLVAAPSAAATSSKTSRTGPRPAISKKCKICDIYIEGRELFQRHCTQNHEYCQACNRPFATKGGLESHDRDMKHAIPTPTLIPASDSQELEVTFQKKCSLCSQLDPFSTRAAYEKHCINQHHYCAECREPVPKSSSLRTHNRKVHSSSCKHCGMRYVDVNVLRKHMSKEHGHDNAGTTPGSPTIKCDLCQISFSSSKELLQHTKSNPRHNWCFVCNTGFTTAAGLQSHLSKVHRMLDHKCPLCSAEFSLPSAVAHHIESGTCRNITRNQVTAAVQSLDLVPSISLVQRITAPGCSMTAEPISSYVATEMSFDGTSYQCWLCPNKFSKLRDLNQHLNSAAHDNVQFKCPNDKCGKRSTLVSGLIQHIESGTCKLATYEEVETYARGLTSQFTGLLLAN